MSLTDDLLTHDATVPEDLPQDPGESYRGRTPAGCAGGAVDPEAQEEVDTLPRVTESDEEPLPNEALRIHHRYALNHMLGIGAQGEVWQATQDSLRRQVAIKRLRPMTCAADAENVEAEIRRIDAFRQEALVAGSLEHPNIIPVHDLVMDSAGRPVLVMKEVRGKPWLEILNQTGRDEDPEFLSRHIPILMAVAQAVAFAHSRGIIHRDLKPSQVMIGEFGEVLLADWGLAMVVASEHNRAATRLLRRGIRGYLVNPAGTPAYMAPEQTQGSVENLGPWTDVFLLGGMLYYLLTGTPPFVATHGKAALLMARQCELDPPQERAPNLAIPYELAELAMKALAPRPEDRVASALEFHAGLEDYLSGAGKRRESMALTEQVRERCRDQAGYTELAEAQAELARAEGLWDANPQLRNLQRELALRFATLALANNDLVLAEMQGNVLRALPEGEEILRKVEKTRERLRKAAWERRLALRGLGVFLILFLGLIGQYVRVEVRARDQAEADRARTEAARANAVTERNLARREQYFSGIGFADASIREARVDKALDTLLNDLPKGLRQAEWGILLSRIALDDMILLRGSTLPETIYRSEFSPDGGRIVTAQRDGTVSLWDARLGRRLYARRLSLEKLWASHFSPDGRSILVTSFDGRGRILDAATGDTLRDLDCETSQTRIMRGGNFSRDGRRVAATFSDRKVRVWNADSGAVEKVIDFHAMPYDVAFTTDGLHLAVTLMGKFQTVLCNIEKGEIVRTYSGHGDSCYSVSFSADGASLVTSCRDRRIRIFDVNSERPRLTISYPESRPNFAAFNPAGDLVAVTTEAGDCLLYDSATGQLTGRAQAAPEMYAVSFHPSGKQLLTTSFSEARLWSLERVLQSPVAEVASLPHGEQPERVRQVSFPLDREIIWSGRDAPWTTTAPAILFQSSRGSYAVEPYGSVTSPDGKQRINLGYEAQRASVEKLTDGTSRSLSTEKRVFNASFSPSGKLAATTSYEGVLKLWDTRNWKTRGRFVAEAGAIWSVDFSPDEMLLAAGCHSGELLVWDVEKAALRARIHAHEAQRPIVTVRFNSDGTRLLTCSSDRTAKLWNVETGGLLATFSGHAKSLISGVFSPDGRRVLTTSFDNMAKLWDVETGREVLTAYTARGGRYLMSGWFSRDGRRAFFTTDKRELFETEILPWQDQELPGSAETPFSLRLELWKRQRRLSPECRVEDIAWVPRETPATAPLQP